MKFEQLLRKLLAHSRDMSQSDIDNHIKEFKLYHRRNKKMLATLNQEVTSDNSFLDQSTILGFAQDIEKLSGFFGEYLLKQYLDEVHFQAKAALSCWDDYLNIKHSSDIEKIFVTLYHYAIHGSNIHKIITPHPGSIRKHWFEDIHSILDIECLNSLRQVRNSLEHIDERMDVWFYLNGGAPILDFVRIDRNTKLPDSGVLRAIDLESNMLIVFDNKHELNSSLEVIVALKRVAEEYAS